MAGHTRTVATGQTRRTPGGKTRRVREHRPAGEAEQARRRKEHHGSRSLATDRIAKAGDPLAQLAAAVGYVRSANAKYAGDAEVTAAVQALLEAGDRIYQHGNRKGGR